MRSLFRFLPLGLTCSILLVGCQMDFPNPLSPKESKEKEESKSMYDQAAASMAMDDDAIKKDVAQPEFLSGMENTKGELEGFNPNQELDLMFTQPTPLVKLASSETCNNCENYFLPGMLEKSPHTRYTIHSDLPEILLTPGVAYTTEAVLPPFKTKDGQAVSQEMRTQENNGFKTIDNDFEVFLFHIAQPGDGTQPRRMVVYAKNVARATTTVYAKQAIITDGTIGTVHQMESTLGRRVLEEKWDKPLGRVTIKPGEGEIVAYSKQFAAPSNGPDSSANVNCFGIMRADVKAKWGSPDLVVYTILVPAAPLKETKALAESLLQTGAQSGEGYINLNKKPSGCALSRACGVFPSFQWRSEPVILDVANLPEDLKFQMALPAVQVAGCPQARQTADLFLSQKTNRSDTVGNYMVDYRVRYVLINKARKSKKVDLRFGKEDADIGLAWQVALDSKLLPADEAVNECPVRTAWAGPKQDADFADNTRSLLEFEGGVIPVKPNTAVYVSMRLMVLGNSSLPFQLGIVSE